MATLSTLKDVFRNKYLKIDPNGRIFGDDVVASFLNTGYTQVQKDGGNQRREQDGYGTIYTVAGTQDYPLPSDFLTFDKLYLGTTEIRQISKVDTFMYGTSNSTPASYYIFGSNVGLYPIPNDTKTIQYVYRKRLPTITDSQGTMFNDDFNDAIALYAVYASLSSVEKDSKGASMLQQYATAISTLKFQYQINSFNNTFSLQRYSPRNLLGPKQA